MKGTLVRRERIWGTGLIVVGTVLLGVVVFMAFAIVSDPGGYYDRWIPAADTAGPEASFDWASSGLEVEFTDTSEIGDAAIERWVWDFGGGAESSNPNPSHRFSAGESTVTLEVVDADGFSSRAEATLELEPGVTDSGEGAIGLSDLADNIIDTVERSTKGGLVVVLVIGLFVVLTMVGGRFISQGVRILRPLPDRISVKLRPKELELAVAEATSDGEEAAETIPTPVMLPADGQIEAADERVEAGV